MDEQFLAGLLAGVTPADLTSFARQVPQRSDFLLTQSILPVTQINSVKYRTSNRNIRVAAAKFRSYDAPTPFIRVDGASSVREGFLPPLGGKQQIEEFQIILDEIARGANDERLVDGLYDSVEAQVLSIYSRLEVAAGDLLADGVITINENGVLQEADFGVPTANKPTAAVLWDQAGAKPVTDELAWIDALVQAGKPRPQRVVTSAKVAALYATNAEYRNIYWGGETSGTTRPSLTPDQVNSVRAQYSLPPITTYDVFVPIEDANGVITNVRTLPDNLYILLPGDEVTNLGATFMGRTAESLVLSSGSNPAITREDAAGLVATAEVTDDPVSVKTKTTAIGLPVLHTPDAIVIAKVLA